MDRIFHSRTQIRSLLTYHDKLFVEAPIWDLDVERRDTFLQENFTRVDTASDGLQLQVHSALFDVSGRPSHHQQRTQFLTNLYRTSCMHTQH